MFTCDVLIRSRGQRLILERDRSIHSSSLSPQSSPLLVLSIATIFLSLFCTPYSVLPTLYSLLCTPYSVYPTLYSLLCTPYFVLPTPYSLLCTPYSELPTLYFLFHTLYSILCTVHSVLYTLHSSRLAYELLSSLSHCLHHREHSR